MSDPDSVSQSSALTMTGAPQGGGASRTGAPQRGGGHQSAVVANGGLETAAPLADTDDPVASISAPSAVTARPEASPHLALPPDGASVEELRAARTAALDALDALDARRERFEPDDSPDSAALLAAVSSLDARIAAALDALSEASDLPAAKDRSAEIVAAVAWIEENAPIRESIDATLLAIDAMKTDLASAEASKYAKAKLGAAETARSDADRLVARS